MEIQTCENGRSKDKTDQKTVTLEEALEITGDGIYKYLVVTVSGINLLAGFILALAMSYVLPATDCDMTLTSEEKGILASMMHTGMIFSSHLFGYLSDNYGRRYVIIRCNLICAFLSILASIAPTYPVLTVLWFINGLVVAGTITPTYVIVSEFCAFKYRTKSLLICAAFSSLVGTYLPCVAWIVMPLQIQIPIIGQLYYSSWRLYLALTALPLILGTLGLKFLPESPKYLLAKGNENETLRILRTMFATNTKKKPEEYPVHNVRLDAGDEWNNFNNKEGFWKTMVDQTCLLFKPPLIVYMIVSCATNLGLTGAYTTIMLWLPENLSKMITYETSNFIKREITLCDVLQSYGETIQSDLELLEEPYNKLNQTAYYHVDTTCTVSVNNDVYIANILIGIVQSITFCVSGKITDLVGRKYVIVMFILAASVCSILVNFVPISVYTTICLGSVVTLVGAVLPMAISIIVDFFPTHVRTMATCICMAFGRIGASAGSQLFGFLQANYCNFTYYGLTAFLASIGVLCLMIPLKKKSNV